jgi:signal transduction histidine kinase
VGRALAATAGLVILIITAAMLVGLWQIADQVREREVALLEGELRLALSRAANAPPVDFAALFELRERLQAGERDDLPNRLAAALPDYSGLAARTQQLLAEQHPTLLVRASAYVGRVTLLGDRELTGGVPVSLSGTETSLTGTITARHGLFLQSGDLAIEIMFEAACSNVDAELTPRLRPLRLGAITLALLLLASSAVTLRAIIYSRTIGAYQNELIDTLAHELHNPVTTLHVGLRTLADNLDEDDRGVIDRLNRQLRRLQRLTERVTVTSRALLHDARPNLALLEPDEEIGSLLAERFPEPLQAGTLRLQQGASGVRVLADRADLEVLVGNLVENALKFSAEFETAQRVLVSTCRRGQRLVITVEDSGPGIEGRLARRLIRPFRQGGQTASGLGLGLFLCRRIARRMRGRLRIGRSELGGACVQVTAPLFLRRRK